MLQNSQSNGQPRENCTLIEAYRRKSASSHNGAGVRRRSGNSDEAYTRRAVSRSKSRKNSGNVTSASFSTKWSTSGNCSWPRVNSGPPATIVLPAARQRATSSCAESCCAIIPLINTTSAQARSFSRSFRTLTSTRRFPHAFGNIAATVSKPKGGSEAFLWMNFNACLKLQNVSGNSGYSSNTFIRS